MSLAAITQTTEETKELVLDLNEGIMHEKPERERAIDFLRKVREIDILKGYKTNHDPDVLAIFPGNTVIRLSDVVSQMNGHSLRRCEYASKCRDYSSRTLRCAYNNYEMFDDKGKLTCYIIKINGKNGDYHA